MAEKRDYYEVLGIKKDATEAEVKKAFREGVKKYHPDNTDAPDAEAKFKEVNEAYQVLSDPQKRAAYDKYGQAAFAPGGGGGAAGGNPFGGGMDFDIWDLFGGDMFGGGGRKQAGPARGADVTTSIKITFEESIFGVDKDITLNMYDKCDTCGGSGAKPGTYAQTCKRCNGAGYERYQQQTILGIAMAGTRPCPECHGEGKTIKEPCLDCNGSGRVTKRKTIRISIPKGISNGMIYRLMGKGAPGERGGETGNLLITVYVQPHNLFRRENNNIYLDMDITFPQAALGDTLTIPTLYGDEKYELKAGTQTGTRFTLRGKGAPNVNDPRYIGDQIVTFNVVVPRNLSEKQQELLREFATESGEDAPKKGKRGFFDKFK